MNLKLNSSLIIVAILVLGFVYVVWKQFDPGGSAGYPDVEEFDIPSFVPTGDGPSGRPALPYEQD